MQDRIRQDRYISLEADMNKVIPPSLALLYASLQTM